MEERHKNIGLEELNIIAKKLLDKFSQHRIFAFYGEMGSGKTTFISQFVSVLNGKNLTSSPSFSLINVYKGDFEINHFDCYRLKKNEIKNIGFEEYIYSGKYCFIEWPEIIEDLLPEDCIKIYLNLNSKKNKRDISIKTEDI